MSSLAADQPTRDIRVIGLVSTAHFFSHFFQLSLPPLFVFVKDEFGVSYTELGLAMTVFYAASGLAQTPAGFLVDRFGARAVLLSGLSLYGLAVAAFGLAPNFYALLPLLALAGLGNSVFHPADYAILTTRVSTSRLGRGYGVHTLAGNLGWACAPPLGLALTALTGSWRAALVILGLGGLAVVAALASQGDALSDGARSESKSARAARMAAPAGGQVALLLSTPILVCFAYFALLAASLIGLQTFMPTALNALFATPLAVGGSALTGYLVGGAVGVLIGGFLADKTSRHELIVAVGLSTSAVLIMLVGLTPLPATVLIAAIAAAGIASGTTTPARDMLVRSATPKGSTGKVFGFVYSGLDFGAAITPTVVGFILDHGAPQGVFMVIAGATLAAVLTAFVLRRTATHAVAPIAATN